MKKIILWIIGIICVLVLACCAVPVVVHSDVTDNTEPTYTYEILIPHIFYYSQENASATLLMIEACEAEISNLQLSVEIYGEQAVSAEVARISAIMSYYQQDYDKMIVEETKWLKRYKEYPVATEVWLYMKNNFSWSDEVCAGVLGNIMAEIGGGTLNFDNWDHDRNTYGMFQWLGGRKRDLKRIYGAKPTVIEQLEFMYDELYGTDGVRQQVTDAQRKTILTGATPEKVAMSFCKYYERPGGSGLSRKKYAQIAYNYFVD